MSSAVIEEPALPIAEAAAPPPAASDVDVCTNCGAVRADRAAQWCRKCGFHPLFGRCIELVGDDIDQPDAPVEEAKANAADGIMHLVRSVPGWAWKASACVLLAVAVSFAGRYLTPPASLPRLVFAISLLSVATISVIAAQLWAFFYCIGESDRYGIGDVMMRPFAIWSATLRDIKQPGMWRRTGLLGFGLTAFVLGLAVVGGIPWARIWELGPSEPPKRALVDSVESVGRDEPVRAIQAPPAPVFRAADCLILGYIPYAGAARRTAPGTTDFESLVLAGDVRGKLTYVGIVAEGIPDDVRQQIAARLPQLARQKPLVACEVPGKWLEPALTCRILFGGYTPDDKFDKPIFDKLLGEIEPKKK